MIAQTAPASLPASSPEAHARAIVQRSGTSFYWGMRLLPRAKREAMFAVYAFCREVDDVADSDAPTALKHQQLERWREKVADLFEGRPSCPITRALAVPIRRFDLPKREFALMIEGMEMDADGLWRQPQPEATLEAYCRRVAGAVGMLSVRIFGAHGSGPGRGARALGEAFQLTNILRDIAEDAEIGRIYMPRERLRAHGIEARSIPAILDDPALVLVCDDLADRAERCFAEADQAFSQTERRCLRPIMIMQAVYRRTLERLRGRGFARFREPVRIGKRERIWLALRHGLR